MLVHTGNGRCICRFDAPQRGDTPNSRYCHSMAIIPDAGRETRLYMHALGSALACASQSQMPVLEIPTREPSPGAQKVRVLQTLDEMLVGLDAVIRSKKVPPTGVPTATLGRRLVERGEKVDAVARTYEPGPGFDTFIRSLITDNLTEMIAVGVESGEIPAGGD